MAGQGKARHGMAWPGEARRGRARQGMVCNKGRKNKYGRNKKKMVDVTEAMESSYLTADLVDASPTKQIFVIDAGSYEETEYGRRLSLKVEIDGKEKTWRPNRDSCANLAGAWGRDTKAWLGKPIDLSVIQVRGKASVVARAGEKGGVPGYKLSPGLEPEDLEPAGRGL